jgi:alanyl aminopeptidase
MTRLLVSALLAGWVTVTNLWAEETADYRLPPGVAPSRQDITLTVDPSSKIFSGRTRIAVTVEREVPRIGIYQAGLTLSRVVLAAADTQRALGVTAGDWEMNWLADGEIIAPGRYELQIDFDGVFPVDGLGMHRAHFDGNDYVFTQFESMYARRAFPCFDEPSFKIPYQITLNAPAGLTVVSNTPVASSTSSDGWQQIVFMQTPPLPSYLVAYAVGPLDRAPIEGLSVPGFIYTPRGRAGEVGFAARNTPAILKALEAYFGTPYHYRKLDFVAVPDFAFGAMENPGLVTFRTNLLMRGDAPTGTAALSTLSVIAHELAHMWYGDLVTMAWWDDMWLNEAFASWMGAHVMRSLYPEFESDLRLPQTAAFASDQRLNAKPVHKRVRTEAEVTEDLGLNYTKGTVVLTMMENYVGEEVFRTAIRDYLQRHAWGNAAAADLWQAIADHGGDEVTLIARDYIYQPGFPLVSIDASGKVTQSRYASAGRQAPAEQWRVPLAIKFKSGGRVERMTTLLQGGSGQLDLPADTEWVFPDAGATGYYRWRTDPAWFGRLLQDMGQLSDREKIALLDNSDGLRTAGLQDIGVHLGLLAKLLADPQPLVALAAIESTLVIGDNLVDTRSAESFARFVDRSLAAQVEAVGLQPRPDDTETLQQLRPRLLRLLGQYGGDPAAGDAALELARRYLASPSSVPSGLGLEALRVAALHGGAALYRQYRDTYLNSASEDQKNNILNAMYFTDPAIVREQLDFVLSDAVQAGDTGTALFTYAYLLDDHTPLYAWLEQNLDALQARLPAVRIPLLPLYLGGSCSARNLALMEEFFGPKGEVYAASLAKATETMEDCIGRKAREGEGLKSYLAGQSAIPSGIP